MSRWQTNYAMLQFLVCQYFAIVGGLTANKQIVSINHLLTTQVAILQHTDITTGTGVKTILVYTSAVISLSTSNDWFSGWYWYIRDARVLLS